MRCMERALQRAFGHNWPRLHPTEQRAEDDALRICRIKQSAGLASGNSAGPGLGRGARRELVLWDRGRHKAWGRREASSRRRQPDTLV